MFTMFVGRLCEKVIFRLVNANYNLHQTFLLTYLLTYLTVVTVVKVVKVVTVVTVVTQKLFSPKNRLKNHKISQKHSKNHVYKTQN